jgi:low affinity Fe/Cu permease
MTGDVVHEGGRSPKSRLGQELERASQFASHRAGSSWAFGLAVAVVLAWLITGPLFGFSNTWQLIINTGTTIVTFLMVFLIQRAQNKEALAIQLKLDEIVAALEGASNRLIAVEQLTETELAALQGNYGRLAELARQDGDPLRSHSIEEAEERSRRTERSGPPEPVRQSSESSRK